MRRQDEEKRRILRERRENGTIPDLALVETNNDTGFEDDDLEEEEEGPEFSGRKVEEGGSSEESREGREMVTLVCRGEEETEVVRWALLMVALVVWNRYGQCQPFSLQG